jgi:hypothetical protein
MTAAIPLSRGVVMNPFLSCRMAHRVLALLLIASLGASAQEKPKEKPKADTIEKVTLQYRVSKDAFAPSKFVAVIDKGISLPLEVTWDLPKPDDKDKKAEQEKLKKDFDDLIKRLEAGEINGVEFECKGEWIKKGFKLRITTVPELTAEGKKRAKG